MSKVLKQAEVLRESPFRIKDIPVKISNLTDIQRERVQLPIELFYKDRASKLYDDATKKAMEIIENAKKESERLINEAKEREEQIKREAFDKGYSDGFRQGSEDAKKELTGLFEESLRQFNELREVLLVQNREYLKTLEKECLKLAIHIAEKILKKHVEVDNEYILGLVSAALDKVGEEKDIVVRISEKDYMKLEEKMKEIQHKARYKKINFIKDPTLSEGDCIIQGSCFELDAGLRTQLDNLQTALKEMEVLEDD